MQFISYSISRKKKQIRLGATELTDDDVPMLLPPIIYVVPWL